jgi:site-specific DNA-cytosine methylase
MMTLASLFTGSGIGDRAAEQCGITTVAQCENDPACLYCLERLFPNAVRFKDVRDVSELNADNSRQ